MGVGSRYTVTTLDNIGDSDFVAVTKALQGSYRPLQNGRWRMADGRWKARDGPGPSVEGREAVRGAKSFSPRRG